MIINCEIHLQRMIIKSMSEFHVIQAESPMINPGVFDLNLAGPDGLEHWIEIKWKYEGRGTPDVRANQIQWGKKRLKYNPSCWMLTGSKDLILMHHASKMSGMNLMSWEKWIDACDWRRSMNSFRTTANKIIKATLKDHNHERI